jgi:hypothetical protein
MARRRPDTALIALAERHGWRVVHYAEDGGGRVEMAPGAFLDIASPEVTGDPDSPFMVGVTFDGKRAPRTADELANGLGRALYNASFRLQGISPEEVAGITDEDVAEWRAEKAPP